MGLPNISQKEVPQGVLGGLLDIYKSKRGTTRVRVRGEGGFKCLKIGCIVEGWGLGG